VKLDTHKDYDRVEWCLFRLCMLNHAESTNTVNEVYVCRHAPMVSHLLFADYLLILMDAKWDNARTLKHAL
jgi:hypothetical protein